MTDDLVPGTNVRRVQREQPGAGGRGTLPITITEAVTDTTEVTADQLEAMLRVLTTFAELNGHDLPVALQGRINVWHIVNALEQRRVDQQALEYQVDSLTVELKAVRDGAEKDYRRISSEARVAKRLLSAVTDLHRRDDRDEFDEPYDSHEQGETPPHVMCSECGELWPCRTFRAAEGMPLPAPDVTYTLRGRPSPQLAVYRADNDDSKYLELYYLNDRWQVGEARQ